MLAAVLPTTRFTRRCSTLAVALSPLMIAACADLTQPADIGADQPIRPPGVVLSAPMPSQAAAARPQMSASAKPAKPTTPGEGQIQASHILVSFKGTMRSTQTRTKDEARARITEALKKIQGGADFGAVAAEYGEDGTKTHGGDLGPFTRQAMVKEFSDAAFALKVGEMSGIVETPFGFHLIKRTK